MRFEAFYFPYPPHTGAQQHLETTGLPRVAYIRPTSRRTGAECLLCGILPGRVARACPAAMGRQRMPPLAWFLQGPIRIRGGLARHFASAWLFHRGSHLEATPTDRLGIMNQYQ